ncbi:MAG: NUDIX hydrolase, partial [Pseudomonadales bacterium]|nr:NUDIX hydrolase [Pseudomonadales bacterium]
CSLCATPVVQKIPEGDSRLRYVCPGCGEIHYQNPNIVAGTIPVYENKILLCKRAIEPRKGFWTLPAGFMENQETTTEAAIRETWEEALARVKLGTLYTLFNIPQIDQVHLFFLATINDGQYGVGEESLETRLFSESEIPWDEISFPTVKKTLQYFIEDRLNQEFPLRVEDIVRDRKT